MSDKKGAVCCVSNSKFDRMFLWGNVVRGTATYRNFSSKNKKMFATLSGVNSVAAFVCGDFLYIKLLGNTLDIKTKEFGSFSFDTTHCVRLDWKQPDYQFHKAVFTENESIYQLKDFM